MRLVGTIDLRARSTYQPTLHKYPNNRYVRFTGHHVLAKQVRACILLRFAGPVLLRMGIHPSATGSHAR